MDGSRRLTGWAGAGATRDALLLLPLPLLPTGNTLGILRPDHSAFVSFPALASISLQLSNPIPARSAYTLPPNLRTSDKGKHRHDRLRLWNWR
jgi:hypothetical protein